MASEPRVRELRDAGPSDIEFLGRMLYEALYVPEDEEPFPESILDEPEIRRYVAGFGEADGDLGVIAFEGEAPVGACWLRTFTYDDAGYGWVEDGVPELSIAVVEAERGTGLGTLLLETVLTRAAEHGYDRVSLSVDPRSPALRLYQRHGFEQVGTSGTSITMLRTTDGALR